MKKRTLAMLMSVCMVFGLLTACTSKEGRNSGSPTRPRQFPGPSALLFLSAAPSACAFTSSTMHS